MNIGSVVNEILKDGKYSNLTMVCTSHITSRCISNDSFSLHLCRYEHCKFDKGSARLHILYARKYGITYLPFYSKITSLVDFVLL